MGQLHTDSMLGLNRGGLSLHGAHSGKFGNPQNSQKLAQSVTLLVSQVAKLCSNPADTFANMDLIEVTPEVEVMFTVELNLAAWSNMPANELNKGEVRSTTG